MKARTPAILLGLALAFAVGLGVGETAAVARPDGTSAAKPPIAIRVGVSRRLLQAINETDGRNLLLANAQNTGIAAGLEVQFGNGGFMDAAEMARAIASGEIDLISIPADEFVRIPQGLLRSEVLTSFTGGTCEEEFLLLVRKDSPFQSVASLVNRRINIQQSTKSHLSVLWLDLLSRRAGLGAAEQAFPATRVSAKASQVILPVFFNQADGAVATRRSLETLAELNPRVARELRAIAVSPPTLSAVLCFRAGVSDEVVARALGAIRKLRSTPMGRQALTLFQIDQFELATPEALAKTRALVLEHDDLAARSPTARPNAVTSRPGTEPR